MNKKDFEELEKICDKEIKEARAEQENSTPFDQQYHIGREHAAKDISLKINAMYRNYINESMRKHDQKLKRDLEMNRRKNERSIRKNITE